MTALIAPPDFYIDLTRDFRFDGMLARTLNHVQTQIVNTGGADNPPYSESHHYCRTEKRISAYG